MRLIRRLAFRRDPAFPEMPAIVFAPGDTFGLADVAKNGLVGLHCVLTLRTRGKMYVRIRQVTAEGMGAMLVDVIGDEPPAPTGHPIIVVFPEIERIRVQ